MDFWTNYERSSRYFVKNSADFNLFYFAKLDWSEWLYHFYFVTDGGSFYFFFARNLPNYIYYRIKLRQFVFYLFRFHLID